MAWIILSDFVQQQGVKCNFADSIPWVILSPIEQSIKQKIESVGIPLKDWNNPNQLWDKNWFQWCFYHFYRKAWWDTSELSNRRWTCSDGWTYTTDSSWQGYQEIWIWMGGLVDYSHISFAALWYRKLSCGEKLSSVNWHRAFRTNRRNSYC